MKKNTCKGLTFADCELAILRMAVDKAEEKRGKRIVNSEDIRRILHIVEEYIKKKKLICYGGTAINNILPEEDQFYNKDIEIPDYDFFSKDALHSAKELTDIYYKKGFTDVVARSGQHHGTYKVFVNYIPVADITHLSKEIYNTIQKEAISVDRILYAPPNFLRMSMYLELSRPAGDISRWEKVLKRLTLLNKNYPITTSNCNNINFQREMHNKHLNNDEIFHTIKDTLINQGVVFFGGFAITLYSQYMPSHLKRKLETFSDFDVLSNNPLSTVEIVKERLREKNIKEVTIVKHAQIGEIIPEHYELKIGMDTVLYVYKPIGCHSYNVLMMQGKKVKIATIDTMLSFYLAFLYADQPYYNQFIDRILCMSKFLFDVQQKNRLSQKGLLARFSINCYGHQPTIEELRAEKANKYEELKDKKDSKEFEEWFLNYYPDYLKDQQEKSDPKPQTPKNLKNLKNLKNPKNPKTKKTKTKAKAKSKAKTKKSTFLKIPFLK